MQIAREAIEFPQETLTRQDVARRQLSTAISLVLGNGDAVSANLLAWAATDVLRGVAESLNIETFSSTLETRIKAKYVGNWRKLLREHYNYFKHADRDPEGIITDFTPEATTWTLFGACTDYENIYKCRTWAILVYQLWFVCRHPEIMVDDGQKMVAVLTPGLQHPADKPLEKSVQPAFEMLENGRKNPSILNGLGPRWLSNLERE